MVLPSSPNLSNSSAGAVAGRQFHANLVSGEQPGEVRTGTIGNVSEDLCPVLELDPVHTVGKRLHHDPLNDRGALGHERRLYRIQSMPYEPSPVQAEVAAAGSPPAGGRRPVHPRCPLEEAPSGPAVRMTGPFSVIATVCSK